MTVADVAAADEWSLAQGEHEGLPLFVRVNTGYRQATDRADHPVRIGVALPLRDPDERGLPHDGEFDDLAAFEDLLLERIAGRAVLVAVLTTGGMREFVLHSAAHDWIGPLHQELDETVSSHEVQVMAVTDPTWDVYEHYAC